MQRPWSWAHGHARETLKRQVAGVGEQGGEVGRASLHPVCSHLEPRPRQCEMKSTVLACWGQFLELKVALFVFDVHYNLINTFEHMYVGHKLHFDLGMHLASAAWSLRCLPRPPPPTYQAFRKKKNLLFLITQT